MIPGTYCDRDARREVRLFAPFGFLRRHIATFWVRIPEETVRYPHWADGAAQEAVKEQFPEYFAKSLHCDLEVVRYSSGRSFQHLEIVRKAGRASNGCRVWTIRIFSR